MSPRDNVMLTVYEVHGLCAVVRRPFLRTEAIRTFQLSCARLAPTRGGVNEMSGSGHSATNAQFHRVTKSAAESYRGRGADLQEPAAGRPDDSLDRGVQPPSRSQIERTRRRTVRSERSRRLATVSRDRPSASSPSRSRSSRPKVGWSVIVVTDTPLGHVRAGLSWQGPHVSTLMAGPSCFDSHDWPNTRTSAASQSAVLPRGS
jgi:hypothetical protein